MILMDGYWTKREAQPDAAIDATGSTGVKWTWMCPFEKAAIVSLVTGVTAATGAVSTGGVLTFYHTNYAGTKTALGSYTVLASKPIYSSQTIDLDKGTNGSGRVRGIIDLPVVRKGEVITAELTTQGSGGTQSVKPAIVFIEKEADTI